MLKVCHGSCETFYDLCLILLELWLRLFLLFMLLLLLNLLMLLLYTSYKTTSGPSVRGALETLLFVRLTPRVSRDALTSIFFRSLLSLNRARDFDEKEGLFVVFDFDL